MAVVKTEYKYKYYKILDRKIKLLFLSILKNIL